ncbi:MAG TPA: M20/M25/M40 family metallo-hydrolase [Steroidobacteraceae bacterium]|nr:M20/M25/M40 family metallo-hydrolase [Steroidobacteraceae bacterium]
MSVRRTGALATAGALLLVAALTHTALAALARTAAGAAGASAPAQGAADQASDRQAREIFRQLIEINTTDSAGSVTTAAEVMAQRFRAAGFSDADVFVGGPNDRKKNVVVRLHGTGKHKPVLLIGHLDVVEARREDWTTDPFAFNEQDGYFYGRGTQDMKDGDAIMAATLLRLKKEGVRPSRDIILALTADEEGGCCNGVDWLLKNHRELIDAEFVLNHDGASVMSKHGVPQVFELGATEKVYGDYQLLVTNRGGHSSLPRTDNAIYALSQGLLRIGSYQFPFELNNVTRAYFERMAQIVGGQVGADMRAITGTPPDPSAVERLSRDPAYSSVMRTTCVATRLEGGHANNALPQRATAVVNCRILPGHSPEEVRQDLIRVLADPQITVRYVADNGEVLDTAPDRKGFPPPPLPPLVMKPLESTVAAMWPGLKVVPMMSAGASDAIYTSAAGLPTYGVAGIAIDRDDVRMHGRDERVGVQSFDTGNEFFYRYLKALTSQ